MMGCMPPVRKNQSSTERKYSTVLPGSKVATPSTAIPKPFFRKGLNSLIGALCICLCWGGIWGCSDEKTLSRMPYMMRVGDCVASKGDFNAAFQALATGYDTREGPNDSRMTPIKLRVLDQLVEELLLCRHAKELNLSVNGEELDDAVDKIKAQYPPGVFEEIMLEHAVPFNVWKRRLHARLLMMKVIETELVEKLDITYDDAAQFLKDPLSGTAADSQTNEKVRLQAQGAGVLGRLRRYQSEQAYEKWLETLKRRYEIEWNKAAIKEVIGQNIRQNQLPGEIE